MGDNLFLFHSLACWLFAVLSNLLVKSKQIKWKSIIALIQTIIPFIFRFTTFAWSWTWWRTAHTFILLWEVLLVLATDLAYWFPFTTLVLFGSFAVLCFVFFDILFSWIRHALLWHHFGQFYVSILNCQTELDQFSRYKNNRTSCKQQMCITFFLPLDLRRRLICISLASLFSLRVTLPLRAPIIEFHELLALSLAHEKRVILSHFPHFCKTKPCRWVFCAIVIRTIFKLWSQTVPNESILKIMKDWFRENIIELRMNLLIFSLGDSQVDGNDFVCSSLLHHL